MIDRPYILTIEISENGDAIAKLDDGQLTGGRQDITYRIDLNITRQLVKKQFAAIRRDNSDSMREVREAGENLIQLLLPREIRAAFPKDGEALLLSTNRHAMPWELLWDKDFLGVRFAMGRQLITRDKIRKPEPKHGARQKTCLFLADPTADLPGARKEADRLRQYFRNCDIACTLIAGEQITPAEIYSYLRNKFDIVHYGGHIDIDENEDAYLRLSGNDRFNLKTVLTMGDFGCPFVFLNGCGGGSVQDGSAKIVRPLIEAGCGPILCATMPITDEGSRLFSEQLITNVLEGMSYGEATMEARKKFRKDTSGSTDWMRFVYYGNPLERLETTVPMHSPQHKVVAENNEHEERKRSEKLPSKRKIPLVLFMVSIIVIVTILFSMLGDSSRKPSDTAETTVSPTPIPDISPMTADTVDTSVGMQVAATPPQLTPATPSIEPKITAIKPKAITLLPSVPARAEDFYGSWKNGTGIVMEISQNNLTRALDGVTFIMNITGMEPVSNSDTATRTNYPSGLRFTGTVAEKGWWINSPETGETYSYTLFLHADRRSFSQNGQSDSGNIYIR